VKHLLLIVVGGAVLLILLIKEALDLAATLDYIEQKFPALVRWTERKSWQRILLIVLTIMYAGVLYEDREDAPALIVTFGSADPAAKNAEIAQLKSQLDYMKAHPVKVYSALDSRDKPDAVRLAIQDKLALLMQDGNRIKEGWLKVVGTPQETQQIWASAVKPWHAKLVSYLQTIPRGEIYVARLQSATRDSAIYPTGMNMNIGGNWDRLLVDLQSLDQYIKDPDLGSGTPSLQINNNAPNGIAISGGNVQSPTVNNFGPPVPKVVWKTQPHSQPAGDPGYRVDVLIFTDRTINSAQFKITCDRACSFESMNAGINAVMGTNRQIDNQTWEIGLQTFLATAPLTVTLKGDTTDLHIVSVGMSPN
jgi:hypothetical protein